MLAPIHARSKILPTNLTTQIQARSNLPIRDIIIVVLKKQAIALQDRIRPQLRTLLDQRKIRRSKATIETVVNELDEATSDLETAKLTLKDANYKWATIQAFHSMFHAARALLNRMGYREQSHKGLLEALRQLYEREIIEKMLEDFFKTMTLTERLHDRHVVSEDITRATLKNSEDFLEEAARILAAPREWFERPAPRPSRTKKKKR